MPMKYAATLFLLGLTSLGSFPSYSGIFYRTYVFEPHKPKIVINPLLWDLDTRCTIQSQDSNNLLSGLMKKKNGELNGKHLKEGETGSVVVKNKQVLHITADYGAQIEITNKSKGTVVAVCKI